MLRQKALGLVAALTFALAGCEREADTVEANLPYADEYPSIGYASAHPEGRLGRFADAVDDGDLRLAWNEDRGYLDSVLDALQIDTSSQVLVYSRTSVQVGGITPQTPRAIYFNDDTYVAWIPAARTLELASYDPQLGPVFYRVMQDPTVAQTTPRQFGTCLRCHDTYSLSGGGVPRFLLGSGYTGSDGELVSHEAWILTTQGTPFKNRWGGWYVTGHHGNAVHLGNIVVQNPEDLQDLESLRVGNIDDLSGLFDTSKYLRPTSDIVALLVIEHQVEVQNLISRLLFESGSADSPAPEGLAEHIDALVQAMLMLDEAELPAPVEGGSGFAEHFETQGPFDSSGRSLRQLDLKTRLFRYPLSYLIYSDAFAALRPDVKKAVLARIETVLKATPEQDGYTRLSTQDRKAITGILAETLPDFSSAP